MTNNNKIVWLLAVTVALLSAATASASIEKEPVRVTHKNSGPKYDFDDVERTRLSGPAQEDSSENLVSPPRNPFQLMGEPQQQQQQQPDQPAAGDVAMPIGRVSIRRIFLVPMNGPQSDGGMWSSQGVGGSSSASQDDGEQPRLFAAGPSRPFWPFMAPPQSPSRHDHLLGADEASRSPTPDSSMFRPSQVERPDGGEREDSSERPRMMIDPIQMMMEMLQHALNPQMSPSNSAGGGVPSLFKDLNKEASGGSGPNEDDKKSPAGSESEGGLEKPIIPSIKNETKEDVIEIDGKKYLRKTIINRHVGENIIFMTKRLIFVPLNETTPSEESAAPPTTTTVAPTVPSTSVATDASVTQSQTSAPQETTTTRVSEPKVEEVVTSTTTTTETPATVADAKQEATSTTTQSSTTLAGADNAAEETTPKGETLMERVSDAISRAVERLEERAGSPSTTVASP